MALGRKRRGKTNMTTQRCLALIAILIGPAAFAADALELKQTIVLKGKAGGLDHLALDVKRDRLFLANKTNNSLDIVDLKAGKLLKRVPSQGGIQGIAYAADLDKVCVGLGKGGLCNIFDGKEYKTLKSIKFADDADNVRYNPKTNTIYVAHAEKSLGVVNAKTYEKKPDIALSGDAEGFELEKERPLLYLCVPSTNEVLVIDTDQNKIVKNYKIEKAEKNYTVALDEANHRVFIGCRGKKPMVVVMDTETGKEITGIEIPADNDDLIFDAKRKRLYASCGEGYIAVIKVAGDKCELLEKVATVKGAKTCTFNPETGKLYLGVPRQSGKDGPEIRVYQAK
jgi:DNA-binding beta-propeller fold protein YncE